MGLSTKTKAELIAEVKKLQRKIKWLSKKKAPFKKQVISKKDKPWSSLFKHSANTVAIIDKKLTIVDINKSSRKKSIGQKAYHSVPKKSEAVVKKAIEKVFKTAKTQEYIVSSNAVSGELVYVSCKASPIIDNGKVINVVVEATNITKEVEAQNSLKQSEEKFRMLAENSSDLVFRYRMLPKKGYEYVSPSATVITGYTPKEFYADPFFAFKLVHPDDKHLLVNSGKLIRKGVTLFNTDRPQVILRWIKKDGTCIWTETRNKPIFSASGKLVAVEGISRDITQQKENEKKLIESEERFRIISNATFEGIVFSENGKIIDANDQFLKMYGYRSLQELLGKHIITDFIVPDQQSKAKSLIRLPSTGLFEIQTYTKDKNIISVISKGQNIPYFGRKIRATVVYNISERKQYEERLRESERTLSMLMNNLRGMAYRCNYDKNWTMRFISKGFLQLTGYSPKEFINNKKRAFADIIYTDDRELGIDQIRNAIKTKTPFEIEYRIVTKKGEIKWVWEKGEGVFSENGELLFLEGFITDVNDKKRYEIEITQSRENYKSLIDYSPDGVIIHVDGKIKFANPSALAILGVTSFSELENVSALEHVLPEYHPLTIERLRKIKAGEKLDFIEIKMKNKKGEIRELETKPIPIKFNGEDAVQVVFHDLTPKKQLFNEQLRSQIAEESNQKLQQEITVRKNAERILQSAQKFMRLLIDSSLDVICASDKNGFITEFNAAGQKVYGYTPQEVIGKHASILYANPEDRSKIVEKALMEKGAFTGEMKNVRKNGEVFDVYLSASLLMNEEGESVGVMGISHDISERKKVEEQMRSQAAKLNAIIESSNHIIWTSDRNYCLTSFNHNFSNLIKMKYGIDSQIGMSMINGKAISTDEYNNFWIHKLSLVLKGVPQYFETRLIDTPDNNVWCEMYLNPIFDKTGEVVEISGIGLDITEKKEATEKLRQSVQEKDVLLKEVHHRVKNNLQVISSILNLQSSYVKDQHTLNILKESQNRIKSMAFIHESLYQTKDLSSINFTEYVTSLSHNLIHSYSNLDNEIKLTLDIQLIFLNLDLAIPCGLIINEIVSNSLKYAFVDRQEDAEITIKMKTKGDNITLIVGDNGIGLPKHVNYKNTESLGLQLVVTLTDQLNGTIDMDTENGTVYTIKFKQNQTKNRI